MHIHVCIEYASCMNHDCHLSCYQTRVLYIKLRPRKFTSSVIDVTQARVRASTYIHTYIHAYIHTYIQAGRERRAYTGRHTCGDIKTPAIQTYRHTNIHTCRQAYIHTYIPTAWQAYRKKSSTATHAYVQSHIHTD